VDGDQEAAAAFAGPGELDDDAGLVDELEDEEPELEDDVEEVVEDESLDGDDSAFFAGVSEPLPFALSGLAVPERESLR
jgi:hypothetical protein